MIFTTYHSRSEKNILDILKNGFQEKYIGQKGGFGNIFGPGVYTSTNLKYVSTYHPECNKIIVCEIDTNNYQIMNITEFQKYRKRDKEYLDSLDLLIIGDNEDNYEYVCKNLKKIRAIKVIRVEKIFDNNLLKFVKICT